MTVVHVQVEFGMCMQFHAMISLDTWPLLSGSILLLLKSSHTATMLRIPLGLHGAEVHDAPDVQVSSEDVQ